MENQIKISKKNSVSKSLISIVENKFFRKDLYNENNSVNVGDIIKIGYKIPEGEKERTQYYEGLIISISNKGLGKSFTLRRTVQGIGVEQVFVANSPKIVSIIRKQASKVRRAKLYFIRNLRGKSTRLKSNL
jgi:large subunit ribosomal protein L19